MSSDLTRESWKYEHTGNYLEDKQIQTTTTILHVEKCESTPQWENEKY